MATAQDTVFFNIKNAVLLAKTVPEVRLEDLLNEVCRAFLDTPPQPPSSNIPESRKRQRTSMNQQIDHTQSPPPATDVSQSLMPQTLITTRKDLSERRLRYAVACFKNNSDRLSETPKAEFREVLARLDPLLPNYKELYQSFFERIAKREMKEKVRVAVKNSWTLR